MSNHTPDAPVRFLPPAVAGLCALAAQVAGVERAEVVLAASDSNLTPAGLGGVGGALELPLLDEAGTAFGTLVVPGAAANESVIEQLQVLADAVARAIEVEDLRAEVFDLAEQAALAREALSEAAGQLVHDVNNPLAAAAMALEIARDEVADGLVAQLLDRAVNSTTRMKTMVTDLLAFSATPVPGSARLDEALGRLKSEFAEVPAGTFAESGTGVAVPLSPGDLDLVLVALLDNAVKFAREGEDPQILVSAQQVGERVVVTVEDSGRGVPESGREQVFTPTLRLDRKIPGMGLGLATVRRLVAAADGTVTLEESAAGGVRVRIEFPAVRPSGAGG